MYARYWQHYHQAMAWMQRHQHAYQKAVESYFSCLWPLSPSALPQSSYAYKGRSAQSSYDHHLASQNSRYGHSGPRRARQHPRDSTRRDQAWLAEDEMESESDGGVECDLSNMEITEELRQYFAETERHKEERRKCRPVSTCFLSCPAFCVVFFPNL